MKKIIVTALAAAVAAGSLTVPAEAGSRGRAVAAGIVGLAAGAIIGGAIADAHRRDEGEVVYVQPRQRYYYNDPEPVYAAPRYRYVEPQPVYVEPAPRYVERRRHYRPACQTEIRYDYRGQAYEWKDCN